MGSPDTNPQSEEFARENQFRVEIPDPRRLYDALDHGHQRQTQPEKFKTYFKIGASHSEDELFSQINVRVNVMDSSYKAGEHIIDADLNYQNPKDQYWTNDQAEKVQELLSHKYGIDSSRHQNLNGYNHVLIKDPELELIYDLALGYEDKETAWNKKAERAREVLNSEKPSEDEQGIIGDPGLLDAMLRQVYQQELNELLDNPHWERSEPSHIIIRPLYSASPTNPFEDAFPAGRVDLTNNSRKFKTFTKQTQKWAKFIEDAVNAMSKVKGIPQSGKLTLLPPSEIPQP